MWEGFAAILIFTIFRLILLKNWKNERREKYQKNRFAGLLAARCYWLHTMSWLLFSIEQKTFSDALKYSHGIHQETSAKSQGSTVMWKKLMQLSFTVLCKFTATRCLFNCISLAQSSSCFIFNTKFLEVQQQSENILAKGELCSPVANVSIGWFFPHVPFINWKICFWITPNQL